MMNMTKRITALLCAAAALYGAALPVHAEDFILSTLNLEGGAQQLDDKGMLEQAAIGWANGKSGEPYYVYSFFTMFQAHTEEQKAFHYDAANLLYVAVPMQNRAVFILRSGLQQDTAMQQAADIIRNYEPQNRLRTLIDNSGGVIYAAEPDAFPVGRIMHELAAAGLIDAFYTFGQTADYVLLDHREYIMVYTPEITQKDAEPQPVDWAAVAEWVTAQHPECSFVCVKPEDTALVKKLGLYYNETNTPAFTGCRYAVIPPDNTAFPEQFAIAAELYAQFGISGDYSVNAASLIPAFGQNALTIRGDATVDGAVDVADAVLTARYLAEDREAEITECGTRNADADGSGTVTPDDVTAILRIIAKKV